MGEAPTLPTAVNLARHISDCPNLFPEVSGDLYVVALISGLYYTLCLVKRMCISYDIELQYLSVCPCLT